MVLKNYCETCTKIYIYDGHPQECCKKETTEIYLCDSCQIILTEDTLFIHEHGIVCYELCIKCMENPKKKLKEVKLDSKYYRNPIL